MNAIKSFEDVADQLLANASWLVRCIVVDVVLELEEGVSAENVEVIVGRKHDAEHF